MYIVLKNSNNPDYPWDIETVAFGPSVAQHFKDRGFKVVEVAEKGEEAPQTVPQKAEVEIFSSTTSPETLETHINRFLNLEGIELIDLKYSTVYDVRCEQVVHSALAIYREVDTYDA